MFVLKLFRPLLAMPGSEFTTSAPDYSHVSVAEFLMMLFVMLAIVGGLLYLLSFFGKRRK